MLKQARDSSMTGIDARRRVLITRAEPEASHTAKILEALGYAPVVLPLFETRTLAADPTALPTGSSVVAVTSANAVRHVPGDIVAALTDTPCFCVGAKSAEAARMAGFSNVVEGGGDAESLAASIISSKIGGAIVYLCGRVRRPVFEDILRDAGYSVSALEIYDTVRVNIAPGRALSVLGGMPADGTLVYSVLAADALSDIAKSPDLSHLFEKATYFCLSERIADALRAHDLRSIRVAAEPTEDALLSLLGHQFRPSS